MKNILAIFKEDLKKLFGNVVNGIVTLGLILLPSIFAFYNIIACWDVFDNTGNVKVAVANTDEGYQSDLIPLRMNLGEQVISALRSNDQIKWEFVSEEEAIDGAKAGRYYAAVVIPSTFSKDMLTFYSDGGEQARITYYSNQKKNVIAPKVTDQGASSVSYAVNEAFAQSVSEISLSLVHVMANYLDENGADARIVALADHLEATSRILDNAASAVEVFGAFGNASKDALDSATKLINATQAGFGSIAGSTVGVAEGVSETAEALDSATATFKEALTASTESYEQLAQAAKDAAGALGNTSSAMASSMRMQAEAVSAQIASYQELSGLLRQIAPNVPSDVQPVLLAMADRLDSTVKTLEQVRDLLNQSADDLDRANAQAKADIVELEKVSAEAKTELDNLQKTYDQEVGPTLEEFERSSKAAAKAFSEGAAVLSEQDPFTIEGSESLESTFNDALGQSAKSADELRSAADQLSSTAEKLREAAMAGDSQTLHDLLSADVEGLAHALAAPVSIERTASLPEPIVRRIDGAALHYARYLHRVASYHGRGEAPYFAAHEGQAQRPEATSALHGTFPHLRTALASADHVHGAWQSLLPRHLGGASAAVYARLLVRWSGVHIHHLYACGIVCEPWQGDRGLDAHRASDCVQWVVPARDLTRFRSNDKPLDASNACGGSYARGYVRHLPE